MTEPKLYEVKASITSESMARSLAEIRNFKIQMDEPKSLGGTDRAPNPLDLFLAAHGRCLNYMSHYIAKEMGIVIKDLQIDLEAALDPAKFSGLSTAPRAGYQSIKVTFKIGADATSEQLDRLLTAVKNRCPVSDNISNVTPIEFLCMRL